MLTGSEAVTCLRIGQDLAYELIARLPAQSVSVSTGGARYVAPPHDRVSELMTEPVPEVLTIHEVAAYLRIGRDKAYELARTGGIPCFRIGAQIRVHRLALERWLDEKSRPGVQGAQTDSGGGIV